jgi:PhoH-like ATPase
MADFKPGSIKNYLIDTNVLLHDSDSMFAFEENHVYILVTVLEELDIFKTAPGETGANSRRAARNLDSLREKGRLSDGVDLDNGGKLFVIPYMRNGLNLDLSSVDNQLLTTAHRLLEKTEMKSVVVTKDVNLRVRADGVDVPAEDYRNDKHPQPDYCGYEDMFVDRGVIDAIYENGEVEYEFDREVVTNHYFRLIDNVDVKHTGLVRHAGGGMLVKLQETRAFGITGRNLAQKFAIDALFDNSIKVVTLRGKAGTGKTLLAIMAGLAQVMQPDSEMVRLTVTRPVIPVGRDLGFLPGDLDEKLAPWMRPIYDAFDAIKDFDRKGRQSQIPFNNDLKEFVDVAPLSYVRGRSIANSFMIVDEAQNMTPHEVKTLMTRAGVNSKIVLTGDTDQIDNPYLDSDSNGFSYLISRFRGQEMHAHIELVKGERSRLAEVSATIL